jgi:hypothetical protein
MASLLFPCLPQLAQLWSGSGSLLVGSRLLWAARRLGVGFVAVAVMKEVSRAVLLAVLPFLYRFFPMAVRRMWQPPLHNLAAPRQQQQPQRKSRRQRGEDPVHAADAADSDAAAAPPPPPAIDPRLAALPHNAQGLPWDVDATSRFFAYAGIGVAVAGVAPRIFQALHW